MAGIDAILTTGRPGQAGTGQATAEGGDVDLWAASLTAMTAALVGAVIGAWLAPLFTSRTVSRAEALLAARIARAGLGQWIRAIDKAVEDPVGRDDDDFDFLLAIQIGAMRGVVDMSWWDDNKARLIRRASPHQEQVLIEAAQACSYALWRLDWLGDAGHEALERHKILTRRRVQLARAADEQSRKPELRVSSPPAADRDDGGPAEIRTMIADVREASAAFAQELRELEAYVELDVRIALVRNVRSDIYAIRDRLLKAVETCEALQHQNGRPAS